MPHGCVDCDDRPRLSDPGSCYTEYFAVPAPGGRQVDITLRLCFSCGSRFESRAELRRYLSARLPAYAGAAPFARVATR